MFLRLLRKINIIYILHKYKKDKSIIIKRNVKISRNTILNSNILINDNCSLNNTLVGTGTYIGLNSKLDNCNIGNFCSISSNVEIISGRHPLDYISSHPSFYSNMKQSGFTFVNENFYEEYRFIDKQNKKFVTIGNDVLIGYGVKILDGIKISDGAIIGAGSLVTKDVDPYSVVAGNPAREIKKRFQQDQINFLLNFKWWNKDIVWIRKNSHYFRDATNFIKIFSKT